MSGSPAREERVPAFDLMGTGDDGAALPYDTRGLSEGMHSITVRATLSNGASIVKTALFEVDNVPAPTPTQSPPLNSQAGILVSSNSLRTGAANLAGAEIDGAVYIWAYPDDDLGMVSFYLDNPFMSGSPDRTEGIAPFDFAGTSWDGNAQAYDTRSLSDGAHAITIRVRQADGSEYVKSASFVVGNGS
jgi:hypothetical protein